VRVWDASTGAELNVLDGHTSWVHSVAFSRDGMRIVSGSEDKTVRVWDASTGAELNVLKGHTDFGLGCSVAFRGMACGLCLAHGTRLCGCGMHGQVQS
jgi:WD40 repeat protein